MRKFLQKYKNVYNVCERMEMTVFSLSFSFSERHYNEMTRHHQFPVMQLSNEGAQSLNNPKNVSSVASPSLTSSLINNNCLLTLREMMQHQQQQYQLHQYHQQQQQLQQQQRKNSREENENSKSQIISTPLSPNSSIKLSPKYHAEKHERESPFSIGKPETLSRRENRNETGANCFKHVKSECQATGRTVREELEASRSNKIPKPGMVHKNFPCLQFTQLNFMLPLSIIN
jgi:hypothetical protein